MIKIENVEVMGWEHAIRGMRNPMNSWEKSDSGLNNAITLCGSTKFKDDFIKVQKELSLKGYVVLSVALFGHSGDNEAWSKKDVLDEIHKRKIDMSSAIFVIDVDGYIGESTKSEIEYAKALGKKIYFYSNNDLDAIRDVSTNLFIGQNDHKLMMKLAKGGPEHAKYRRMISVYVDITAPLYWWKEFDTYKVGTVANSCSTMHKIHEKEFTLDDFSCEHLTNPCIKILKNTITYINYYREEFLKDNDKHSWWQIIQLLPSSYNQRRTVMLNYEVLANIYKSRKNHKLNEWCEFCNWIKTLPYSEIITEKEVMFI